MEHDLMGLEDNIEKQDYILNALNLLCGFRNRYHAKLTPKQREVLDTAIRCTAIIGHDLMEGMPTEETPYADSE